MFRFQFDCKSSVINRYAMIFTAVSLALAIFGQINRINIVAAVYVIVTRLLGKIDHIKYALSISLTGWVYDFFYVCFHSSNSSWFYVKFIEFVIHFAAFIFEIMWIMCVFCYLKQEETKEVNKSKVTWIEKQMGKVLPEFKISKKPADEPMNDDTLKDDAVEIKNDKRSETDTTKDSQNNSELITEQATPLNEVFNETPENNEQKQTSSKDLKEDTAASNNESTENNIEPSFIEKPKTEITKDS